MPALDWGERGERVADDGAVANASVPERLQAFEPGAALAPASTTTTETDPIPASAD
jgi:hypothetical protein